MTEEYIKRTATSVKLTWTEGASNGGSNVIDYQITYDNASGSEFVILQSNIYSTSFEVVDLTTGSLYTFKVQARNSFGLSEYSESFTILAGF
jgi:hypothetical protein